MGGVETLPETGHLAIRSLSGNKIWGYKIGKAGIEILNQMKEGAQNISGRRGCHNMRGRRGAITLVVGLQDWILHTTCDTSAINGDHGGRVRNDDV